MWLEVPLMKGTTPNHQRCGRPTIKGGFKDQKRGGWGWHHTKMRDPRRTGRLWLAMAVATLCVVGVGGNAEAEEEAQKQASGVPREQESAQAETGEEKPPRGREESCF